MRIHELTLSDLSKEQIQEALHCLYHELEPQDPTLKELKPQEWGCLVVLLNSLMREKKHYSLH